MQSNKVIILTGGSSGIGRAAALRFAKQGDKVLVTGRRAGPLDQLASDIRISLAWLPTQGLRQMPDAR
jgi:NAD(P)-dependent dehydrogenase (short-subunit alcohol dehydrogenase family)